MSQIVDSSSIINVADAAEQERKRLAAEEKAKLAKAKKVALAKLTKEERKILGVRQLTNTWVFVILRTSPKIDLGIII